MKKFLLVLMSSALFCGLAWADVSRASVIPVGVHPKVHKHKAHKAGKHPRPKRSHHHTV